MPMDPCEYRVRYIFHTGDEGLAGVERDAGTGSRAWAEETRAALVAEGADAWIERVDVSKAVRM